MPERDERHRLFDRIVVAVGGVTALAVAAAAAYVLTHRSDLPTPDDDDLMAHPAEAPEPNGYDFLREAAARAQGLGADEFRPRLQAMLDGSEWEPVLLDELERRNAAALKAFERGIDAPGRLPEPSLGEGEPEQEELNPMALLPLVDLVAAGAIARSDRGERDAAVERALLGLRAGRALAGFANATGSWLSFAAYCQSRGAHALGVILPELSLTRAEARALVSRIEAQRIPPEHWQAPWATEYRQARAALFPENGFGGGGYWYQPNRSLAVLAARVRERQHLAGRSCRRIETEGDRYDPLPTGIDWLRLMLAPNAIGRRNVDIATATLSQPNPLRCATASKLGLAQLAVALKAWTQAEGALPDTLDALVPGHLDALPRDAFDGAPLRYSKQNAVVYSIGDDLVDSGGTTGTLADLEEPALSVDF